MRLCLICLTTKFSFGAEYVSKRLQFRIFVRFCGDVCVCLSDEKTDKKCNPPLADASKKKGLNVLKLELSSVALN